MRPRRLASYAAAPVLLAFARPLCGADIYVTGTGDTIAVDGLVTLREAITSANNNADVNADVTAHRTGAYGSDLIGFDLTGSPPYTISLNSALPAITGTLAIDGTLQQDFVDKPVVEIEGSGAGASVSGLT
ncbi:MAG TPA: hypothetical protein VGR00_10535, partial [Thermoanaerobaculia bacterium]|nr:hypothetical protein [Thermoanaerobaculia bacterium]